MTPYIPTRTGVLALLRIEKGLSAFGAVLPSYARLYKVRMRHRREAVASLYRYRLIKRGPFGPVLTAGGRRLLADLRTGKPVEKAPLVERYGLAKRTLEERAYEGRRCASESAIFSLAKT